MLINNGTKPQWLNHSGDNKLTNYNCYQCLLDNDETMVITDVCYNTWMTLTIMLVIIL